jgi:tetratricopeptide (TPR) repeat protein
MLPHSAREALLFTSTLPSSIDWHDARAMEPLDGPLARYPLARVVFLAHRCRASGLLRVFDGENTHSFHLREGTLVGVEGVSNPLGNLQDDIPQDLNLDLAVGRAIAAGHSLDAVLDEVSKSVGIAMAGWCLTSIGILSYKDDTESTGWGFRLPKSLIAMLSHGLHTAGSPKLGQAMLQAQPTDPISVLLPEQIGEQRLGLDALSLRVLNLARAHPPFQDLVARATRGNSARRREVLHRVFMLHQIGLLHLPEPPVSTEEETQQVPRRRSRPRRGEQGNSHEVRRSRSPERSANPDRRSASPDRRSTPSAPPTADQQLAKLRKRVVSLQGQNFYQRLGLGDAKAKPAPKETDEAFHKLSKRYHPDAHGQSSEAVRDTAEDVFALLTEAIDGLRKRRVAEEHWERNRCAQQGIPYVTDRDRTKAKMSFKKGERLFRNRDYAIAEACFHEAHNKDPLTPTYAYMHAYSAFLAKQMPAEEALKIIGALKAETNKQTSEFHATLGRIIRLSGGSEDDAMAQFDKALGADPDNRDAQRERRLHAMREEAKPKAGNGGLSSFLGRFRRKGKD